MSSTTNEPEKKTTPEPPPSAGQDNAGQDNAGQPHPVDVKAQEEAAKDRVEGGGYN